MRTRSATIAGHTLAVLDPSSCTCVWVCECGTVGLVIEGDIVGRLAARAAHKAHAGAFSQGPRRIA